MTKCSPRVPYLRRGFFRSERQNSCASASFNLAAIPFFRSDSVMVSRYLLFWLATFVLLLTLANAQAPVPNGSDGDELEPIEPESPEFKIRLKKDCTPDQFRTIDGTCSSVGSPARQLWGSTNRPQFSYFVGRSNTNPTGMRLTSPRNISNIVCKTSENIFDPRGLSEITTFFGQFVDHTVVATPENHEEKLFIDVPEDDPLFSKVPDGKLEFFRSRRVGVKERDNEERPQNALTSVLDLVSVYGPNDDRSDALRDSDGLMMTSARDLLPFNTAELSNQPSEDRKFFVSGDQRVNEHPILTSLHTLFLREHNNIARELKTAFPAWDSNTIFENARKINGAQFQKIVFEEWYPALTGQKLRKYRRFNRNTDPTVSLVFTTAAFRVGHTMVGNFVNRRGVGNSMMKPVSFKNIFFAGTTLVRRNGIEPFLRGAIVNRAQKIDTKVHDALRDFLFTNVPGVPGIDLISLNLQRGRDHALPSYNAIRIKFGRPKVVRFDQISSDKDVQSALESAYGSPRNVEAWIGLVAEDHAPGSSMGPTMLAIWRREFTRIRDGDRFYYEAPGLFSQELKDKIPRVNSLFTKADAFRAILLRNTEITESELPSRLFFSN